MIPPPQFLFVETTNECNLRCRMCHLWLTREPETTLRTEEKLQLIAELASWSPRATVVLTGGETMQKREEFFALSMACRAGGLSSAANTNGSFIDEAIVDRLLVEGPKYLVLSLDSHRADVHDWARGAPGTYDRVICAIRQLVRRRSMMLPCSDVRILVNCILFDRNLAEMAGYIEFVGALGVDGIMFQALSRTFGLRSTRDGFFERHFPRDLAAFDAAIQAIVAARHRGAPIATTENDLHWMRLYARDPDFIGEQVCGSAERNVMVDMHGNVQLCFQMHSLFGGRVLGNVRQVSLRSLWESEFAVQARHVMASCRKNCGMLHCHRRTESG